MGRGNLSRRRRFLPVLAVLFLGMGGPGLPIQALGLFGSSKPKFTPYYAVDEQMGGIAGYRLALPEAWKGASRFYWDRKAHYVQVHVRMRAEAPDGAAWVDFFPAEMFWWFDRAHDRGPWGRRDASGAIHQADVHLAEAMARFVILPQRRGVKNLRLVGYRAVQDLPKMFAPQCTKGFKPGFGICIRVQYEQGGQGVDEEFFGFMPQPDAIRSGAMVEYHGYLLLAHSLGARGGRLETLRPTLNFIATSLDPNPAWIQKVTASLQARQQAVNQQIAQGYASIARAKAMSQATHAQNEAFLARVDASLAQSQAQQAAGRASYGQGADAAFDKRCDNFDQYIRGTERVVDQNGQQSEQSYLYAHHWSDGNGTTVHTNDPNLDPNHYLNGSFARMTPAP